VSLFSFKNLRLKVLLRCFNTLVSNGLKSSESFIKDTPAIPITPVKMPIRIKKA